MVDVNKLLTRGVEEVIVKEHLESALRQAPAAAKAVAGRQGKKLRVKLGIDPTAPDLHLGHTVALRKLRQFQDTGHTAVLIIGDFTARIGDPTGRSVERKPLTKEEVKRNMKKYLKQAGKIINLHKAEVHYNSKWLGKSLLTIIEIARAGSFQQMSHRADFKKRLQEGHDITVLEMMYPLFQGYDSVRVRADVEIGGTDQKFNLLTGRRVQRHFGIPEQDVIIVPLLEGTDGVKKMSKSYGNYIALDAGPNEMFGGIMSIPDELIDKYYTLLTDIERTISDPREAKLKLAKIIVSAYHGEKAGEKAKEEFIAVFSKKQKPSEVPSLKLKVKSLALMDLLVKTNLASSRSEARRLIEQGAVRINDVKKTDPNEMTRIEDEIIIQVGRRHFLRIYR